MLRHCSLAVFLAFSIQWHCYARVNACYMLVINPISVTHAKDPSLALVHTDNGAKDPSLDLVHSDNGGKIMLHILCTLLTSVVQIQL